MHAAPARRALLAAATALLSLPAAADTLHVPQDHATIQAAVDAAADGDTIRVSAGTYPEALLVSGKSGLILQALGKVVLDAGGAEDNGVRLSDAPDTQLTGLRVTGALDAAFEADDCPGLQLVRCRSEGSLGDGFHVKTSDGARLDRCRVEVTLGNGIRLFDTDDATVRRCRVEGVATGVFAEGCDGLLVERNVLLDVQSWGLLLGVSLADQVNASQVLRNTIDTDARISIGIELRGVDNVLERNVIRDVDGSGLEVDNESTGNTLRRNRVLRATGTGFSGGGAFTTLEDNRFVDVAGAGIESDRDGLVLLRNRVLRAGGLGIDCNSLGATVTDNRIVGAGLVGLRANSNAGGSTLADNRVVASILDGLQVLCDNSAFTGNVVVGAGDDGFELDAGATGNVLTENRASGSAGFDLRDDSAGANSLDASNHFKTTGP